MTKWPVHEVPDVRSRRCAAPPQAPETQHRAATWPLHRRTASQNFAVRASEGLQALLSRIPNQLPSLANMQRQSYNPPPAHSPPRTCDPDASLSAFDDSALKLDRLLLSKNLLTSYQSTIPSPSMSLPSPNCAHHLPRSRPRSLRTAMATHSKAAACRSRAAPTTRTPHLAAS
jgi:hypothetical protein